MFQKEESAFWKLCDERAGRSTKRFEPIEDKLEAQSVLYPVHPLVCYCWETLRISVFAA